MRQLAERMREFPLEKMRLLSHDAPPPRVLDPRSATRIYAAPHPRAVAVRVLSGRLPDLLDTRMACEVPVIAWHVLTTEYQVWEARAYGADGVLLSARSGELDGLVDTVSSLGMTAIVRVNDVADAHRVTRTGTCVAYLDTLSHAARQSLADRLTVGCPDVAPDITLMPARAEGGVAGHERSGTVRQSSSR